MDHRDAAPLVTVIGIALTVISFLAYVAVPDILFVVLFAIGIVMMVGGYGYVLYLGKKTDEAIDSRLQELGARGYIVSLDDSYVPYQDEATIVTLG